MANPNDRVTIQSLRLTINEALELLEGHGQRDSLAALPTAVSMLQAAYDNTAPEVLDKDCGCG